jgi:hypothetical protein
LRFSKLRPAGLWPGHLLVTGEPRDRPKQAPRFSFALPTTTGNEAGLEGTDLIRLFWSAKRKNRISTHLKIPFLETRMLAMGPCPPPECAERRTFATIVLVSVAAARASNKLSQPSQTRVSFPPIRRSSAWAARFCASLQFGSCSENLILIDVSGQTLRDFQRTVGVCSGRSHKGRPGAWPSGLWDELPARSGSIHHLCK